jgi:hypothetical protein
MHKKWFPMPGLALVGLFCLLALTACSSDKSGLKRVPEGQQFSGFLTGYDKLTANAKLGNDALTFVSKDANNNLRHYVAVIVDPVEVFVSTRADASMVPERARETLAIYFRHALENAVSNAYPIVSSPGPLVLRLRSALVGVDTGGAVAPLIDPALTAKPLPRAIVLEKVAVEMELVDSVSGERIAAMVDHTKLGVGAEVGTEDFSRVARYNQARDAMDQWAHRVREFLDSEHELTGEDAERADRSYRPYGQ